MDKQMRIDPIQAYLDVIDWRESRNDVKHPVLLDSVAQKRLDKAFVMGENTIEYKDNLDNVNNSAVIISRVEADYRYCCAAISKYEPEIAQSIVKKRFDIDLPLSAYLVGSVYLGSRLIGPKKALSHGETADKDQSQPPLNYKGRQIMTEIDNAIARIHDRIVYNDERHHAIRNSLVSLECTLREIDREIEREIDPEMLSELYAQRQNISDRYFGAKDAHERLYVEYRDCQHRLAVLTEAASYV